MSTDLDEDRKWDELADRGDLRTSMQRINHKFDRIERLQRIEIITIVCGLIAISLK
jgi:hypothetical protein